MCAPRCTRPFSCSVSRKSISDFYRALIGTLRGRELVFSECHDQKTPTSACRPRPRIRRLARRPWMFVSRSEWPYLPTLQVRPRAESVYPTTTTIHMSPIKNRSRWRSATGFLVGAIVSFAVMVRYHSEAPEWAVVMLIPYWACVNGVAAVLRLRKWPAFLTQIGPLLLFGFVLYDLVSDSWLNTMRAGSAWTTAVVTGIGHKKPTYTKSGRVLYFEYRIGGRAYENMVETDSCHGGDSLPILVATRDPHVFRLYDEDRRVEISHSFEP
jgi:hypothetical protein